MGDTNHQIFMPCEEQENVLLPAVKNHLTKPLKIHALERVDAHRKIILQNSS